MTKRHVSLPDEAESALTDFIDEVDERLASDEEDTCDVVEDVLIDLTGDRDAYERWQASASQSDADHRVARDSQSPSNHASGPTAREQTPEARNGAGVSTAERVRLQSYDPCNTTLESEYYAEKDEEAFEESKHLQWLWRQFDSLPIADNVAFALRFRAMLADHLFESCGDDCRFFKGITFTYGHNISVGDNTVIHDGVHLDDRGKLTIGDRASISDGAHLYSHDHDIVDQTEITNFHTIVADDARVTYDAMVRAGCKIGENAIVGARAVVQGDVPAHHIAVGTPAKSVKVKPGWEDEAVPLEDGGQNRQDERRLESTLPDDLDVFDEFEREW